LEARGCLVLAQTVSAIGLTLALTINPAPILQQTTPPGPADNPVRGADATVGWIVANGRDRSPTFDALVGRVDAARVVVVVGWSTRQTGSGRLRSVEDRIGSGRYRVVHVVLPDDGNTETAIVLLGQELQRALDALEGRAVDGAALENVGHAIRTELETGT
jgi:hypothetical protein